MRTFLKSGCFLKQLLDGYIKIYDCFIFSADLLSNFVYELLYFEIDKTSYSYNKYGMHNDNL